MKTIIACFILFFISYSSFGQVSYTTSCKIKDGRAYGYVHNHKESFSISGKVFFYFYDKEGLLTDIKDEHDNESIWQEDTEKVEDTFAPNDAFSCTFDVAEATEVKDEYIPTPSYELQRPKEGIVYSTSCKIEDGKAYGYVHNYKESLRISGKVFFYFYDKEGQMVGSKNEYDNEHVWREASEEIETTSTIDNACDCIFEIKDAID